MCPRSFSLSNKDQFDNPQMKPRTTAGDRACIWSWVTEISSHNVSGFQSEWKSVLMADYNLIRPNRMDTETKVSTHILHGAALGKTYGS